MNGHFRAVCILSAGMAAGLAMPMAQATPLHNGSFELPGLSDGAVQQVTPDGWQWAGQPGFVFNVVGTAQSAADGDQFVDIGNTSSFSLRQDFTVAADGRYRLSWYDNAAAFFQVAPYRIVVGQGLVDLPFDANEGIDGSWNLRSVEVDLQAGTLYQLAFSPSDIPGPLPAQDRYIDAVTLSAVTTPVPEPTSLWLLAAGLAAGLGAARRGRPRH